jgi:hypothetical protein
MKTSKFLSVAILSSVMLAGIADASSIGRSGGGGGGRSVSSGSSHSSSMAAPSRPAPSAAPAPSQSAKPGGIGGNTSGTAMGVRKSEVTAPVANNVNAGKPGNVNPGTPVPGTTPGYSNSTPSYGNAPQPGYGGGGMFGGGFGSSFAGALGGTLIGNALFSNHGNGSCTTVINNGTPSGGVVSNGAVAQGPSGGFDNGSSGFSSQPVKKEYTMWNFIGDLITFVILVALLVGIFWLFYKGYKMIKGYINSERGVGNQPFNPTARFWEIQRAFASADVVLLKTLLGPDLVDEATNGLVATTLSLAGVSHEVRLNNNAEFSIWYTFTDNGEQINQVWHYEKFGKEWLLNGIETV